MEALAGKRACWLAIRHHEMDIAVVRQVVVNVNVAGAEGVADVDT